MNSAPWLRIAPALAGLGLLYLATQFARNALGVISDDIEEAFALHATETALLAGTMFLAYGLGQFPAAALLTRFGPRIVLPAAGALLALSLWAFASAQDFSELLVARLAMGLGAAPILAGCFAVYTGFGDARFTMLTGLQTAFGRCGVVAATIPFALLVAAVGWRMSLVWAAAATAAAALAATGVLLNMTRGATPPESPADTMTSRRMLITSRSFRVAVLFQGVATAVGSTILGLWGGPWLSDVYGMEVKEQGMMLLALALAAFVSAPLWGYLARHRAIRPLLLGAAAAAAMLLAVPALVHLPRPAILPWLALLGLVTGFYPAVLDQLRRGMPRGAIISISTLLTAGTMLVVFIVQFATGLLADQFPGRPGYHPEMVYSAIFGLMAGLLAIATFGYSRFPDGPLRPVAEAMETSQNAGIPD